MFTTNTLFRTNDFLVFEELGNLIYLPVATRGKRTIPLLLEANCVHLFFSRNNSILFQFSPNYSRILETGNSFFLFNPTKDQSLDLCVNPGSSCLGVSIPVERLHRLFMRDGTQASDLPFLSRFSGERPIYDQILIDSHCNEILRNLSDELQFNSPNTVMMRGLILQLIGLYFKPKKNTEVSCPFLKDQDKMVKIKDIRNFLLDHLTDPPTISQLAKKFNLNEQQVKKGFKELYGNTVYGFVLDAKLSKAKSMLESKRFLIKEISFQVGYQNTSQFIAAFKRKFGKTPKKMINRINS